MLSKFFKLFSPEAGGLMFKKNLSFIVIISLSVILLMSCGSSRQEDDMSGDAGDAEKQQELDEIEALLGITAEEKAQQSQQQKTQPKEDDQLGLLAAGAVPVTQSPTGAETQQPLMAADTEVDDLQKQIDNKDKLITDLKAQVRAQSDQIYQLETQKQAQPARIVAVGDVSPEEYQSRYQEGLDLFHANQYRPAIQVFESLLASSANNSLSDNAQYWIGESHYALREYSKAVIDFEKVFTFPKSNKNDAAQFKLGLCYVRLGDGAKAREEFQRLIDVYPQSDYVKRAQEHLATL
jgi:tol-pal system protein YbgF